MRRPVMSYRLPHIVLLGAVSTIALGYGTLLPVMPALLGHAVGEANKSAIAWHTGVLSGVYMFAVFLLAPMWGRISDRLGRKPVILLGMAGYVLSMALFRLSDGLAVAYVSRILAGALASAVLPVSSAYITDLSDADTRARWFALMAVAALAGFLVGPSLLAAADAVGLRLEDDNVGMLSVHFFPFAVALLIAMPWAIAAYRILPDAIDREASLRREVQTGSPSGPALGALLLMTALVTYGLGSFEVGVALEGRHGMGFSPTRVSFYVRRM